MGTSELILMGQATIKLIIDMVIKPTIQEENHKYIPYVALALGIAWALAFMWEDLATAISSGVAMWLWAMWVNKMTSMTEDLKKKSSLEVPNWGFDAPDARDRLYEAIFWADYTTERPRYVNLAEGLFVQNQWEDNDPDTSMACGSYSMAHCINANNKLDDWDIYVEGNWFWSVFVDFFADKYKELGIDPIKSGSYKQDQLTLAQEMDYIIAYTRCTTIDDVKENLARGRAIQTGSKQIDYKATKLTSDKIAVIGTWPAHLFAIVGYDDDREVLICMNSRGSKTLSMDKGFFYIRYEDIGALYTMHALFDFDDQPVIDKAMKMRDAILAVATKKIAEGKKLLVKEKIALRSWGYGHLIPKNEA